MHWASEASTEREGHVAAVAKFEHNRGLNSARNTAAARAALSMRLECAGSLYKRNFAFCGTLLVNPRQMVQKSTFDKDFLVKWSEILVKSRFFEHLTRIDKEVPKETFGNGGLAGFPCQCLSNASETDFQV